MSIVGDQLEFNPSGLTRSQFDQLSKYASHAHHKTPQELLEDSRRHLDQTKEAYASNRMINMRLATSIVDVIEKVVEDWESLRPDAKNWLAGAFFYFAHSDDDEPDFNSPIGFEDDVEVLNACLRFSKLEALCLKVEDYDDA